MNILKASAIPTSGTWLTGDIVINNLPGLQNSNWGWICILGGTPGIWQTFEATLASSNGPTSLAALNLPGGVRTYETSATNLEVYSQASWGSQLGANGTIAVASGAINAPDGTATAQQVTASTVGANIYGSEPTISSSAATASIWVATSGGSQACSLALYDDTSSAYIITENFIATTTWQRITVTSPITSGHAISFAFYPGGVTGTGVIQGWGLQLEAGAYATPYIPTTTTAVTRALGALTTDAYQASGLLLQLLNNESEAFSVGFSGHILPAGASPSIAVNTAVWGVAVNTSVTGGDSAFIYRFETPASGQGAATANTTLLFTVTLANAYSAAGNIVAMCSYGGSGSSVGAGGTPGVSSFYCVVTADNTIQVYPTVTFTPGAATYYYFSFITMGAGATS